MDVHADPRRRVTNQTPRPGRTVPVGTPVTVELGPPVGDVQASADFVPAQHTPGTDVADPTQNGGGSVMSEGVTDR